MVQRCFFAKDNRYLLNEYRRACKKECNLLDYKIETTKCRKKNFTEAYVAYVQTAPLQIQARCHLPALREEKLRRG
jgi:hypothetical protein